MSDMPAWVRALMQAAQPHLPKEFVGRVELNVFKGGVANATVLQTFKQEDAK